MKSIMNNLRIFSAMVTALALSSCGSSISYEKTNAKYFSALKSVLASLNSTSKQSKKLLKRDDKPNPSLAKAVQDALSLSYYFFDTDGISKNDLSLAYSSSASIGETKLGIVTRCRYIEDTSSLGVYFAVDTNDERSCFYLDGTYDDNKKEMTTYSFYACDGDSKVNQYLEKNDEGFLSVTERSDEIAKYDAVAKEFNDYLNEIAPTYVNGALLEAYNNIQNGGGIPEEPTDTSIISVSDSMTLKAYSFDGKETTDLSHPLLVSCEKDITKEALFNGEVFHTYAYLPDEGLVDITDRVLSSTAFYYVRIENKNPVEVSLESHNGPIVAEGIKWAKFYDGNLVSPSRGENFCMIPPDWHESEPYQISSTHNTLYDPAEVKEFVIWLDGNYFDDVPSITISFS